MDRLGRVVIFPEVLYIDVYLFFFFQAEDGIRDRTVTGVKTCALPISPANISVRELQRRELPGRLAEADVLVFIDEIGRASCRERVQSSVGGGAVEKKKKSGEREVIRLRITAVDGMTICVY